jgi:hypothetical protein
MTTFSRRTIDLAHHTSAELLLVRQTRTQRPASCVPYWKSLRRMDLFATARFRPVLHADIFPARLREDRIVDHQHPSTRVLTPTLQHASIFGISCDELLAVSDRCSLSGSNVEAAN